MNNKDMPAYPGSHKRKKIRDSNGDLLHTDEVETVGLTKLEAFTMAALQGLCGNSSPVILDFSRENIAEIAVKFAEAALAELEKRS